MESHDRLVGRTYREAARACEARLGDETAAVREALRAFADLGTALIGAWDTGEALDTAAIADGPGWEGFGDLVTKAAAGRLGLWILESRFGSSCRISSGYVPSGRNGCLSFR